ncbi:MAG: hypothetical protein ACJA01_001168 [Saprospiraceae bacterium]|jgi:hypothetical protein
MWSKIDPKMFWDILNIQIMKRKILTLVVMGILFSCNSTDKSEQKTPELSESEVGISKDVSAEESEQLVVIDSDEALIATALMAAPKESRMGSKVIGYNMVGEFVTLKEGDNEFICLADNPKQSGFSAACYHKDLESFMARGRELKSEGKNAGEIFDIREEEVKSGKLDMGKTGSTLHLYYGADSNYNPETSEVEGAKYRYVVYMPWATAESTGLPETPIAANHPWIMNPGTHRAHIMISPLVEEEE